MFSPSAATCATNAAASIANQVLVMLKSSPPGSTDPGAMVKTFNACFNSLIMGLRERSANQRFPIVGFDRI